ncbi:MAG: hypothetical protein CSA79_03210 [Thiothrix nivea]|nr:MAG: hypothetical protein CSA79_03210 [Thiothrix nivea]
MNDAKGHASSLLILSLVSVLAVAGVFIWALNQSSFFPGAVLPTASSMHSTRPTPPVTEIRMPDIRDIQPEKTTTATATVPSALSPADQPATKPPAPAVTVKEKKETEALTAEPASGTQQPEQASDKPFATEAVTDSPQTEESLAIEVAKNTPANAENTLTETSPTTAITVTEKITETAPAPNNTPTVVDASSTDSRNNAAATSESARQSITPVIEKTNSDKTAVSEPARSITPVTDKTTAEKPDDNPVEKSPAPQKNGWIYAGQYKKGHWLKRGLDIPDTQLPVPGHRYKLIWGTNVRLAPPGKRKQNGSNLAKNIGYLAENNEVEITRIKNSGKTGHIWLEIKY